MHLQPELGRFLRAKELIFTGRKFSAQEAAEFGLITHLVPSGSATAKALEVARTIAENAPLAVRQAKLAIDRGLEMDLRNGMVFALEAYQRTVASEDRLEGARAFNEKRKPRWQGK